MIPFGIRPSLRRISKAINGDETMLNAPRKFLIEANETYIARDTIERTGKSFLTESAFFGAQYLADDLIEEFGDDVSKIYRVNTETMAVTDITEEIAQAWIIDRDQMEFGLEEEDLFPAYVRNSMAWKRWNDDVEAMAPVNVGTLDKRTQGLGVGR